MEQNDPGRKLRAGYGRKAPEKIQQISGRNTASTSGDFRGFPAGSGDVPASFLQDPAGSSGRNLRPGEAQAYVNGMVDYVAASNFKYFTNVIILE
jgi:hypothetical protein